MENFNKSYKNKEVKSREGYSLNLKINNKLKIYNYFFILRIVSCYAVVLIHLTDYYKVKTRRKINSFDWKISYF